MADRILINAGAPVAIQTTAGTLYLQGHGAITMVTDEQMAALKHKKDFTQWVDKGYILLNAQLHNVNDAKHAAAENAVAQQEKAAADIKLTALTNAIMANEGVTNKDAAEAEARKRLAAEADKAEQAGDNDAKEIKAASKAKIRK